jgi:periplasmic protein TonB
MFNAVVDRKKRRAWTMGAIAISVAAHLLVLGEIVAAANRPAWVVIGECLDCGWDPDSWEPELPALTQSTPPPGKPAPSKGQTPAPGARGAVLPGRGEPPPNPGGTPEPPDPGDGPGGAVTSIAPMPQPTTGDTDVILGALDGGPDPIEVEELPRLLDPGESQRILQRVYPSTLRDAGVTGHTTVLLVVDENGAVMRGSVTVQETTHDAFREAAVRAAERFRFRPARVNGQPVAVMISLPIEWTIQH